jgi:hypothetical protein
VADGMQPQQMNHRKGDEPEAYNRRPNGKDNLAYLPYVMMVYGTGLPYAETLATDPHNKNQTADNNGKPRRHGQSFTL